MKNLDQHFHAFTCGVQLCNNRDKNASFSLSLYSFASTSNTLQLVSLCPTVVSTLIFPFHHFDCLPAGISVVQLISVPTSALACAECNLADSASFSKVEPKVRAVDSLSLLRGVESSGVHKTSLSTSVFYFLKVWRVNVVIVREVIWFLIKVYVQLRSILSGVLFLCLFS